MSQSDDNKDWDFSDSEDDHRSGSEERRPDPSKNSHSNASPRKERAADAPPADPNAKKSALQALVEENDEREYRPRGGGDRRGRGRDYRDRDDRRGGYRDKGERGGGRPRGDREFSNYTSTRR